MICEKLSRKEILEKIEEAPKDVTLVISFDSNFEYNTLGFKTFNFKEDIVYGYIDWSGASDGWAIGIDTMKYSNDGTAQVLDKIFGDAVECDNLYILSCNPELENENKNEEYIEEYIDELFIDGTFYDLWYHNKIKINCQVFYA